MDDKTRENLRADIRFQRGDIDGLTPTQLVEKLEELYGEEVEAEHAGFVWQRFLMDPKARGQVSEDETHVTLFGEEFEVANPHTLMEVQLRNSSDSPGRGTKWLADARMRAGIAWKLREDYHLQ